MSRVAYVNGRYIPLSQAAIRVEDRGFQFADAVYEVCEVRHGRLIDEARHLARLRRSLAELDIGLPMGLAAIGAVLRETVRRNRVSDGVAYLQVTRGAAPRNFRFPVPPVRPTMVVTARSIDPSLGDRRAAEGVAVITLPDNRWERVDIKTTGLLASVMAKNKAKAAGAFEAWLVDRDGFVTEGASSNAWIVTRKGTLVTRPADRGILRGVTRGVVFDLAARLSLKFEERPFSVAEALKAREAFITAATAVVMPVIRINTKVVGNGRPGPVAGELRRLYHDQAEAAPELSGPTNQVWKMSNKNGG
jgi:D-alanine transaminase